VHATNTNERTEVYLHALIFVHDGAICRASRPGEELLDTRAIMDTWTMRHLLPLTAMITDHTYDPHSI